MSLRFTVKTRFKLFKSNGQCSSHKMRCTVTKYFHWPYFFHRILSQPRMPRFRFSNAKRRENAVGRRPAALRHSPLHQSAARTRPEPHETAPCGKTTRPSETTNVRVLCGNMMHLVVLVSVTVRFIYVFFARNVRSGLKYYVFALCERMLLDRKGLR